MWSPVERINFLLLNNKLLNCTSGRPHGVAPTECYHFVSVWVLRNGQNPFRQPEQLTATSHGVVWWVENPPYGVSGSLKRKKNAIL